MNILQTSDENRAISKLSTKAQGYKKVEPQVISKILKQLKIFQFNHKHPSLRNHKLSGHLKDTRSVSAGMKIRILYNLTPKGTAYFFDIGTHDGVYKK